MSGTYRTYSRVITAGTSLTAPQLSANSSQAILGSATAIGVVVNASTGITLESQAQPLVLKSTLGGDVTLESSSVTAGDVIINAGGQAITIGAAAADAVTIGNSTSGSVSVRGAVTLGGGASDTVVLGGSGSSTSTIGGASGDLVVVGASGATARMDTHLTTSSSVDLGTSSARFGTAYVNSLDAVTVTATNLTFSNQTLAWSTTLMQDESAVNSFIGTPTACKVMSLNLSGMTTDAYYTTDGTTRYYPLQWDDPRSADSASERIGYVSGNAQIMKIMVVHMGELEGAAGTETWNLVYAPKTTALKAAMTVVTTTSVNNVLVLEVADATGLAAGDALTLSGFSNSSWNGRTLIASVSGNLITTVLAHASGAADESGVGTATVQSQLASWATDIKGGSRVPIASSDMTLSDTGFDSATAGSIVQFESGPFPVYSASDAANDTYLAVRISTAGTHPSTGAMRVYVLLVSAGVLT